MDMLYSEQLVIVERFSRNYFIKRKKWKWYKRKFHDKKQQQQQKQQQKQKAKEVYENIM